MKAARKKRVYPTQPSGQKTFWQFPFAVFSKKTFDVQPSIEIKGDIIRKLKQALKPLSWATQGVVVKVSVLSFFLITCQLSFAAETLNNQLAPEKNGFKIIQFLGKDKAGEFALVAANEKDGVAMGVLLKSYRSTKTLGPGPGIWVETGELKVVGNRSGHAFAQILKNSSPLSQEMFPRFSGPMAGDLVVPSQVKISKLSSILPRLDISYFDLFDDPGATPISFELSESGKTSLDSHAKKYAGARVQMIVIEGHTSYKGAAEANQIESYERAKTVRSYLIDKYGFDPDKVLAVGYGESSLKDNSLTAGHEKRNRRIVIKAIDLASKD